MIPHSREKGIETRRSTLLKALFAFLFTTALIVIPVLMPGTHGKFTASVVNNTNMARVLPFMTCRDALMKEKNGVFAYQLNTLKPINLVDGTSTPAVDSRVTSSTSPSGCAHDTPGYLSFPGGSGLAKPSLVHMTSVATTQTFTQEIWFRTNTAAGGLMYAASSDSYPIEGNFNRQVYLDDSGRLAMASRAGLTNEITKSPATVADGKWHHAVAVRDNAAKEIRLYLDGKIVGTGMTTITPENYSPVYWRIGCARLFAWYGDNDANQNCYTGDIAFAAVYNQAFTQEEVTNHYRAGTW